MKITIDTTTKTIEIEGLVNFEELVNEVKKLLPNDYKDYSFKQSYTTIYYPTYTNPVIHPYTQPYYYNTFPTITSTT